MKFLREFYFRASFIRAFYFRAPPFFSFSRKTNFRATAQKFGFTRLKHSDCWYIVGIWWVKKKKLKICLLRIAQFYFRALLVARITLIRADYIFAQEHCAKIKLTRKFHELRYSQKVEIHSTFLQCVQTSFNLLYFLFKVLLLFYFFADASLLFLSYVVPHWYLSKVNCVYTKWN